MKFKKNISGDPSSINTLYINLPKEELMSKRSKIVSPEYLDFLYSQQPIREQYKKSIQDVNVIRNKIVEEGMNSVAKKEDFENAPWYYPYDNMHPGESMTCIGTACELGNRAISDVNPKWKFPIQTSNIQFNNSLSAGKLPYEEIPLTEADKGDILQKLYANGTPYHAMIATDRPKFTVQNPDEVISGVVIKGEKLYKVPAISEGHLGPISFKNNTINENSKAYRFVGDIPKLKSQLENKQSEIFKGKKYL